MVKASVPRHLSGMFRGPHGGCGLCLGLLTLPQRILLLGHELVPQRCSATLTLAGGRCRDARWERLGHGTVTVRTCWANPVSAAADSARQFDLIG